LNFPPDAAVVRANVKLKHYGYDLTPEQMKQKFERSKELLEKQLEDNPDDAFALFNMAQLLRGVGRNNPAQVSDEIIQYASRAVELTNPEDLMTRNIHLMALDQLGWAFFYKKDYQQARDFAERAIGIKHDYLDPMLLLGHVYTQLQIFDKAQDAYLRYVDIQQRYDPTSEKDNIILVNPDSRATAFYGLGMICEIQSRLSEALQYYEKTAELNFNYLGVQNRIAALTKNISNQTSGITAGESLLNEGSPEEADKIFQAIVSTASNKAAIIDEVAQSYFAKGYYREASKYFWQLLNVNPNDPKALNDLANCHFKMKEYEKALEYYETALELPDAPVILFRNMGMTCSILKQFGSAIIAFRKYIAQHPEDSEIYSIMADLYSRTGDFAAALPLYEKSLRVNPGDYEAVFNLSECYLNLGHEESAKVGYYRVLELKPDFEPAQKRITQLQAVASEI
jgi:tetratricopeptide (TPR) repeat protein